MFWLTGVLLPLFSLIACTHSGESRQKTPLFHGRVLGFSGWDSLSGGLSPLRACYDVRHYDLEVWIDPGKQELMGSLTMQFDAVQSFDRMQVDLNRKLKVEEIRLDGRKVNFTRRNDLIYLKTKSVPAGGKHELVIHYEGSPPVSKDPPWRGGMVWSADPDGKPWAGAVCEDENSCLWWPNKAHPSDEPDSMTIRLLVPMGLMGIANGRLARHFSALDGQVDVWEYKVRNPINSDNVSFYLGNFMEYRDTLWKGDRVHHLEYFVLPSHYKTAQSHFPQLKRIVRFMEKRFGPYPFPEDGFKVVDAPYVGMEHQSAIAYGNGFDNGNNYQTYGAFDYILLHETAHQWFGNSLTAADVAENWLHEGFATYSEALFLEQFMGKHHYQYYLNDLRKNIANKFPLIGPRGVNYHSARNSDIYTKGAWVLHTFRSALANDSLFDAILYEWPTRFEKQIVTTADFVELVNEMTDRNWDAFFEAYVMQAQPPMLEYFQSTDSLFLRWTQVPEGFEMPIQFLGKDEQMRVNGFKIVSAVSLDDPSKLIPDAEYGLFRFRENPELKELKPLPTSAGF